MKLTSLLALTWCCCVATTGIAQENKTSLPYRFATRAEAQMLVTDIDNYTSNWNQFYIEFRLQKVEGKKSELHLSITFSCKHETATYGYG